MIELKAEKVDNNQGPTFLRKKLICYSPLPFFKLQIPMYERGGLYVPNMLESLMVHFSYLHQCTCFVHRYTKFYLIH